MEQSAVLETESSFVHKAKTKLFDLSQKINIMIKDIDTD